MKTREQHMHELADELGVPVERVRADWVRFQNAYEVQPTDEICRGCLWTVYVVEDAISAGKDPIEHMIDIDQKHIKPGQQAGQTSTHAS
jgi:hypothetical protein